MKTLIRIYKEAKRYWKYILIATVATLSAAAIDLIAPKLTQEMVAILELKPDNGLETIIGIAVVLLVLYAVRALVQFLNSYFSHYSAWSFVADIRGRIYNHFQTLSMNYYHDKQTGQLMSVVISDTATFEMLLSHAIPDLIKGGVMFIGVTIILFTANAKLALITCIPIPLILISIPVFKKIRAQRRKSQVYVADLNASLQDNFSGIKEIQLFNREQDSYKEVSGHAYKHANSIIKSLFYSAILHPSIEFLTALGNVFVVGIGGFLAYQGQMNVSEIVGFLLYLGQFYGPISSLARITEDLQSGIAGGERVFEVLDTEPDIYDSPDAIEVGKLDGKISFDHVSFSYQNGAGVLKDISFEISPNNMVAVVGATGVGKTTLASLIPRFYEPTDGVIKIDDMDVCKIKLSDLRKNISMVLQDVFLFNGTIKENIAYGKPNASMDEIIQASKVACVHDFITSLPNGYNTKVGERGMRLSGGQKQRISIARSVLCDSSILILDEATSSVDTETEKEIQEAIQQLAGSKTMLVIAHRLSTVKQANSIIVLQEGRIVEQGTHDELIKQKGLYAHLCDIQTIK